MPAEDAANVPPHCRGERCSMCRAQAVVKVSEEPCADEPPKHGLSAYLCRGCFLRVMQPWKAPEPKEGPREVGERRREEKQ